MEKRINKKTFNICVDFDGTCVTHDFPRIGKDIGAVPVLKKIIKAGHNIILFTMRSNSKDVSTNEYEIHNKSGDYLTDAVKWFKDNDIPLYGINKNPTQSEWTSSPKAYGQLYIDDAALGCPLKYNTKLSKYSYVDWVKVELMLQTMEVI